MNILLRFIIFLILGKNVLAIRGGYHASIGDVPYHVSIEYHERHVCNGGLVLSGFGSQQIVVTSASCVTYPSKHTTYPAKVISILAGRVVRDEKIGAEQRTEVDAIIADSKYDPTTHDNDIAILFLKAPFNITRVVKPLVLPHEDWEKNPGDYVVISGFGITNDNQMEYKKLKLARVRIRDHGNCINMFVKGAFKESLCLGGYLGSPCIGDEGGPAIGYHEGRAYLAGIYQKKFASCDRTFSALFAYMAKYTVWIRKHALGYI